MNVYLWILAIWLAFGLYCTICYIMADRYRAKRLGKTKNDREDTFALFFLFAWCPLVAQILTLLGFLPIHMLIEEYRWWREEGKPDNTDLE